MYTRFYGFNEKPFEITPDPRFLYLSDHHKEALAHLIYAAKEGKGLTLISGEVGTGKTMMGHTLLSRLDSKTKTVYLFNPNLSPLDFLQTLCASLGLNPGEKTKGQYLSLLHQYLLEINARGEKVLLIIDEAQSLSPTLLEEIRLLTNLETDRSKLLLIVLLGQPELNDLLDRHEFRQLKQRIILRYHIQPLNKEDTKKYIAKRLTVAGAPNLNLFSTKAIKMIYQFSEGIPRLINIVCDNALLTGFAIDQRTIRAKIIREVINRLNGPKRKKQQKVGVPVLVMAMGCLLLWGLFLVWRYGLLNDVIEGIERIFFS